MATEQPKTPKGIREFKEILGIVASVPKELVDARVEHLKKARKKRRNKG